MKIKAKEGWYARNQPFFWNCDYDVSFRPPPPHFHARYQEQRAEISIDDCEMIDGYLSTRVMRLVREWHWLHKEELMEKWGRLEIDEEPFKIEPLRSLNMRYVIAVEPLVPYKLRVTFDNGAVKIVDMASFLHRKIYAPLEDFELFKRVRVDLDTIVWENGADSCPNLLYEIGQEIVEAQTMEQVEV